MLSRCCRVARRLSGIEGEVDATSGGGAPGRSPAPRLRPAASRPRRRHIEDGDGLWCGAVSRRHRHNSPDLVGDSDVGRKCRLRRHKTPGSPRRSGFGALCRSARAASAPAPGARRQRAHAPTPWCVRNASGCASAGRSETSLPMSARNAAGCTAPTDPVTFLPLRGGGPGEGSQSRDGLRATAHPPGVRSGGTHPVAPLTHRTRRDPHPPRAQRAIPIPSEQSACEQSRSTSIGRPVRCSPGTAPSHP